MLLEPSFELIDLTQRWDGIMMLRRIETLARISHRSEDRQHPDSWERFIKFVVMEKGDWSVTEHQSVTVIATLNRGMTHELVRHRIASFTQESSRFCDYGKTSLDFVPSCEVKGTDLAEWLADLEAIGQLYLKWRKRGYAPQIARDFLPNALASKIAITCNLRQWRHVFMMRSTVETHPDVRRLMGQLLQLFKERVPLLYDDLEPMQKQSVSIARPR